MTGFSQLSVFYPLVDVGGALLNIKEDHDGFLLKSALCFRLIGGEALDGATLTESA